MSAYYGLPLNPEPWTVPNLGLGRNGGKVYPTMSKAHGLVAYQEAVREQMAFLYPEAPMLTGNLEIEFYLWRHLAVYEGTVGKVQRHIADATNCQKALEDALQGVLYENDIANVRASTWMIEQSPITEPFIIIQIGQATHRPLWIDALRDHVERDNEERLTELRAERSLADTEDRSTFEVPF